MNFVHCMICYSFPSRENKNFLLSSCGHIACAECVSKGCFALKCRLCKKENPRVLSINGNMKQEYAEMFLPLDRSLSPVAEGAKKFFEFQSKQRGSLVQNLIHQSANYARLYEYCKAEEQRKKELQLQLEKLNDFKKKAERYIMDLKARLEAKTGGQSMNLTAMTHDPFHGGGVPGIQRSFITSTPYQQRSIDNEHTMNVTDRTGNASSSFSAATGIPKMGDSCGDLSDLVKATLAVNINKTPINQVVASPKKRTSSELQKEFSNGSKSQSAQRRKKTRLDLMDKSEPISMA